MASAPDAPVPFDLGLQTPLHLPQIVRAALIRVSEQDISEDTIPGSLSPFIPSPLPGKSNPQGRELIHDFHGIDQYVDFNPRQRQPTRPAVMYSIHLWLGARGLRCGLT
ncbi:hypothetical protein AUP68_08497 [Ilyonectria robusta]